MQMRIAYIARQRRALTKAIVGEAVERYFQALASCHPTPARGAARGGIAFRSRCAIRR